MPYKSRNWEKMRIEKSPGCKREAKGLESEDFKSCVVAPKWAITDQVMKYAAWGPPRVENLIVYAKSPIRDFETRKKKWEEKLETLWKETGYALRPEAHIASKREIEKNNAWDGRSGAEARGKGLRGPYVGRRYFGDGERSRSHSEAFGPRPLERQGEAGRIVVRGWKVTLFECPQPPSPYPFWLR